MIKLLTDDKINGFKEFCDNRITAAVIYTLFLTYGHESSDAYFWYSEDDNENMNAVFSLSDGVFLVSTDDDSLHEEIEMFSQVVGASSVSYSTADYVLKYSDGKKYSAEDITGENVRDAFDVVFEEDENRRKYFGAWYSDVSHKIRHNLIHGKCIYKDGRCVSVAFTSGETDSLAVISAVSTLRDYRKNGFGEKVVLSLAQSLEKDVYLMTDSEKTKNWYEKMGFVKQ